MLHKTKHIHTHIPTKTWGKKDYIKAHHKIFQKQ